MTGRVVVAVTGANGYVGAVVADALSKEVKVIPWVRTPRREEERRWSFTMSESEMAKSLRQDAVTHIIHAAWEMKVNSLEELKRTCVVGTRRLLLAAKAENVRQVIFISTISAFEGARSAYGRSKLAAETLVAAQGGIVFRLGLVCGSGTDGMFGSLRAIAAKHRVIPVIGNAGAQYVLHERSLTTAIRRTLRGEFSNEQRVVTLAHPNPIGFPDLMRALAAAEGRKVFLIPIPWPVVYFALRIVEGLGLRMRFRSDSIISLVHQNPRPDFTPLLDHRIETVPFSSICIS